MSNENLTINIPAAQPAHVAVETTKEAILAHVGGILVMYLAAYLLTPPFPYFGFLWYMIWITWPGIFFKRGTSKGVFVLGMFSAIMPYIGRLLLNGIGMSWFFLTFMLSIFVIPWFAFYALRYALRPYRNPTTKGCRLANA